MENYVGKQVLWRFRERTQGFSVDVLNFIRQTRCADVLVLSPSGKYVELREHLGMDGETATAWFPVEVVEVLEVLG